MKYNLSGTQTEKNLAIAFTGETVARTKYLFYSEISKEENYPTIAKIFDETADNERGHAEIFMDYLTESENKKSIDTHFNVQLEKGTTAQNLEAAIKGEAEEYQKIYPKFAEVAESEGFPEIAESFRDIASIEKWHHDRFEQLLKRMEKGMLFDLPKEIVWVCTNCGFHIKAKSAPERCPSCHHPKYFFMAYYDEIYPIEVTK